MYGPTGKAYWVSGTNGKGVGPYRLVMQTDGNLVLYDSKNAAWWASNTMRAGTFSLKVQDDCNAVIYNGATAIWSTNTPGANVRPIQLRAIWRVNVCVEFDTTDNTGTFYIFK